MIPIINASKIYSVLGNNSSLIPLGIKDVANSCGLTTASYLAGDKLEGKDRFIDEFGTQAIWLGGIPAYKFVLNKLFFKPLGFDPNIDVRVLKDKNIIALAKKYAPNQVIKNSIQIAAKNQKGYKIATLSRFVASTVLTALTYFGLTKFRHNYTEKQITKDYRKKQEQSKFNFYGKQVPFKSAFAQVHSSKQPSFTGGIQDFIFNPVKNLMLVDATITTERLTHARNPQDFMGYAIKEGSFWAFMYFAGDFISKAMEKRAEKKYNKSIDLDARIIENEKFKNSFKDGSVEKFIEEFKQAVISDKKAYEFAVKPENENIIIRMAKESDLISIYQKTGKVDTRKYINLDELRNMGAKVEKLYNQYKSSTEDIEVFFKSLRKLKRAAVLKNIGSCIAVLGVLAPTVMLAFRKFGDNTDYQVKKDVEAKLAQSA